MRRFAVLVPLVVLLLGGCASTPPPAAVAPPTVTRDWTGRIEIPGSPLDVGVHITPDGGGLRGEIDIPTQGVTAMRLGDVRLDGSELTFTLPDVPGDTAYRGAVAADGSAVDGGFTQGGRTFALVLHPGSAPGRPQEPKPPFPYRAEDVTVDSGDVELAGTLTMPQGSGPFDAVVLITGSGAQDRDEQLFGHRPFLVLADALTRAGHAVLRVDDRGVGGSGGKLDDATYEDLTGDAVAGVEYLRGRAEIDPGRIGLLGHSEGGYIAPLVAQRTPVAFVVLLAGPAASGEDVLILQNRTLLQAAGASPEQVEAQVASVREVIEALRAQAYAAVRELATNRIREQTASLPPDQQPSPEQIAVQADATATPYYRAFVVHDPAPSLRALDVPVLAFYGGKDLQVPATQSEPLLRQLLAGNQDATIRTLPELNHPMQPAVTGSVAEYGTIETTIAPEVLDTVTGWLAERFPS